MGLFDGNQPVQENLQEPAFMRHRRELQKRAGGFADQAISPMLEKQFGYVSPMNQMKRIASQADLTNMTSVQNTFNQLMQLDPKSAAAWIKSVQPIVEQTSRLVQLKLLQQVRHLKMTKKIYKNVHDIYSRTFCKGGMIGKDCQVPIGNKYLQNKYAIKDNEGNIIDTRLPTPEEFAAEFGANTLRIFKERTGQQQQQAPKPANGAKTEDMADAFNLNPEEKAKWGAMINQAKEQGVTDDKILEKLRELRKAQETKQMRSPIQPTTFEDPIGGA